MPPRSVQKGFEGTEYFIQGMCYTEGPPVSLKKLLNQQFCALGYNSLQRD
jgi:hypothetical protein